MCSYIQNILTDFIIIENIYIINDNYAGWLDG